MLTGAVSLEIFSRDLAHYGIYSKFVFSLGSDLLLEALISTVFFSTRPASLQNSS